MAIAMLDIDNLTNDQVREAKEKVQAYLDTIWPEAKVTLEDAEYDEEEPEEDEDEEAEDKD